MEDFPQLILVLVIETKLKRFGAFAIFSYWLGTITVITKNWFNRKYDARGKKLEFKLNIERPALERGTSMDVEVKVKGLGEAKVKARCDAVIFGIPLIILFFVAYFKGL